MALCFVYFSSTVDGEFTPLHSCSLGQIGDHGEKLNGNVLAAEAMSFPNGVCCQGDGHMVVQRHH